MRSSTTSLAVGAFLVILLVMTALVPTTGLRVQDLGPAIVYGVAIVGVGVLLFAPTPKDR
jgi:hypothetical protein